MTWKEFFICLKRLTRYFILACIFLLPAVLQAQPSFLQTDHTLLELRLNNFGKESFYELNNGQESETVDNNEDGNGESDYPDPEKVMYRSMMIPGWGQVTNGQVWKVPLVYAIFAGVGYYNYRLTKHYRGFRAAYYNETRGEETDYRFGETPDFVPLAYSAQQLKETRDNLRNQRDFSYVIMVLAYGLNVLDAYVFAHMRSFDVSDDLSANARISPGLMDQGSPGIHVSIRLNSGSYP